MEDVPTRIPLAKAGVYELAENKTSKTIYNVQNPTKSFCCLRFICTFAMSGNDLCLSSNRNTKKSGNSEILILNSMKRFFLLFVLFSAFTLQVKSQRVYTSTFEPMTYSELAAPLYDAQRAHNQARTKINDLIECVAYVLEQPIDDVLRNQMNSNYNTLNNLSKNLNTNGVSRELNRAISETERLINSQIISFNSRVEEYQNKQRNSSYGYSSSQEPRNNLGKTYLNMSREWPDMTFVERTEEGYNMYVAADDDIYYIFYFMNEILKRETAIVESKDGFARQYYDSLRKAFYNAKSYNNVDWGENQTVFYYSNFKISMYYYYSNSDGVYVSALEYSYLY